MIRYLLKFVSKLEYAQMLVDGKLFMRPASYYRRLEMGQGDMGEGAVFPNACIYKHSQCPIYCLYAATQNDIDLNGCIHISNQCIEDFGCSNGYIVAIDFEKFKSFLKAVDTHGYELDAGMVNYYQITCDDIEKLFVDQTPRNLFIKRPYFSYQHEFRVVIAHALSLKKDSIIYESSVNLSDATRIVKVSDLRHNNKNYTLALSNRMKDMA